MSKHQRDGGNVEEENNQDKRQHRQDEGNIDAALLDEANQFDTATTAVANATYRDLIQHDENEHAADHGDSNATNEHHDQQQQHNKQQDVHHNPEEDEDEDEEDEEELDDNLNDPDHVPDESGTMDVKVDDTNEDDEDEHDKKVAARRGRKAAPVTGSEEWKRQRKDSHKEVERRRRENINLAINKLSDLLPVKENSKATILARAAEYIQKLRETESANIDKWTLQKLLSEQNQSRLTSANERLQEELGKAYKEIETLKSIIAANGLSLDSSKHKNDHE